MDRNHPRIVNPCWERGTFITSMRDASGASTALMSAPPRCASPANHPGFTDPLWLETKQLTGARPYAGNNSVGLSDLTEMYWRQNSEHVGYRIAKSLPMTACARDAWSPARWPNQPLLELFRGAWTIAAIWCGSGGVIHRSKRVAPYTSPAFSSRCQEVRGAGFRSPLSTRRRPAWAWAPRSQASRTIHENTGSSRSEN